MTYPANKCCNPKVVPDAHLAILYYSRGIIFKRYRIRITKINITNAY